MSGCFAGTSVRCCRAPSTCLRPIPTDVSGAAAAAATSDARAIEFVLEREGDVAAVIAEPVRSTPSIPHPDYWRAVRAACDRHGALLVFDEIPQCLGRTGRMFVTEHFGVVPDILVLGKGLGGGILPLAAIVTRPELDVMADRALGHYTHEKNPVTAAAALATIQYVEREGLAERARTLGERALARLREMAAAHRLVGDVRGLGLLLGVELVRDRQTRQPAEAEADAVTASLTARAAVRVRRPSPRRDTS